MGKPQVTTGALVGALLTAPLIALMYLANRLVGLPFIPFDLFDWITRVLPGDVITFGIDTMITVMNVVGLNVADSAKTAEQISAVLQFWAGGILIGGIEFAVLNWRNIKPDRMTAFITGVLFGLPLITISIAIGQSTVSPLARILWLLLLFLAWAYALTWVYKRLAQEAAVTEPGAIAPSGMVAMEDSVERISRRQFLVKLGGASAAFTVVGAGVGAALSSRQRRQRAQELADSMAHLSEGTPELPFPNGDDPIMPVQGTRPEYTPVKDHYKVFLRTEPTVIPAEGYFLPITGLVDNPLMLSLDDIRNNYQSRDQYVTLSCISGRIGTSLISTTQWTGVSMQDILADAGVQPGARYLNITSGDGFHEIVDLDLIAGDKRIMLCYAWDGNTLPVDHGFPLRIWLPDRYGMKQPKWITGMEVADEYVEGYWVERNWDEVAQVKTTSVIDTVAIGNIAGSNNEQIVLVGGIAFSGARGISKVEVRVDGGPWEETQLRSPLSETTWVIWRYEWPFAAGEHTFEVRCAEGDGTPQIEEVRPNRPSGATGIHSREATLS